MLQSQNIGFHFRNIVKFICAGIKGEDKITTHIFKRNSYVNKFPHKLPTACIKSIDTHCVGWGAYEYI